ncbi:MAG TPA: RNA 2',3'-cyclic phosphodiesterase [Casimicrobiaceae bacterium]|jgi:2'-5' RNA ligase
MERSMEPHKLRLFFALVPDAAVQASLGGIARDVALHAGGRAIVDANIHLTLAFIGDVHRDRADSLREILRALPSEQFVLALDCIGTFRNSQIAWIAPSTIPAALLELQSSLAAALAANDFPVEERPFHAHVTLARRCARNIARTRHIPVEWRVERVALMASTAAGNGGVCYREVAGISLVENAGYRAP